MKTEKVYIWLSDPHGDERDQYPLVFEHPTLGTMPLFSTILDLVDTPVLHEIAQRHADKYGVSVRLASFGFEEILSETIPNDVDILLTTSGSGRNLGDN